MNAQEKNCRLCNAIQNPLASGELRPCDTILFKTKNFVLLPSIGPLVRGHAMVVSRKHYSSLASMPQDVIREYDDMVQMFFGLPAIARNLLEAEHGSTLGCCAGACVVHTHIHLMPGLMKHHDFMDGSLRVLGTFPDLAGIHGFSQPYILLRGNLGKVAMFAADSVPTQAIRRVLCDRLGQTNWDWRTEPRNELIEETVAFWKAALANV
jgi:diadenosine tetraphosphate (Ap4A) HIT family hydrolase